MDRNLWQAFAGKSVLIPPVGSEVYYFAQGHVEHSIYTPLLSQSVYSNPATKCIVTGIDYHVDAQSDEVFIKLNLHPVGRAEDGSELMPSLGSGFGVWDDNGEERDKMVSFGKILTPSDANNGGGFSVPRYCAESIFPPLNYNAEPPVQNLSVSDAHGTSTTFRHIFRGTPRRHLLTTGWSKFVNQKMLVAGDTIVFAKNSRGDLFVGIRRRPPPTRSFADGECSSWNSQIGGVSHSAEDNCLEDVEKRVFSRRNVGKVPAESVSNAAELAAQFKPFELIYYPRLGRSEFVVQAEKVNRSMQYPWFSGIKVKMAVENEDSSKTTYYQGTITSVSLPQHGPWKHSPWRMLEVLWDEPDTLHCVKYVSPWEVEFATLTPPIQPPLHPAKKFKGLPISGMMNGEKELFSRMMSFGDSTMEQFHPSLLNFNSLPAGMQGARQKLFCASKLFNPYKEIVNLAYGQSSTSNLNAAPNTPIVSTDLLIGNEPSDTFSPDSQVSVLSFATGTAENLIGNSAKDGVNSIQLFGKIIYTNQPVKNGLDNGVNTNDGDKNPNQSA